MANAVPLPRPFGVASIKITAISGNGLMAMPTAEAGICPTASPTAAHRPQRRRTNTAAVSGPGPTSRPGTTPGPGRGRRWGRRQGRVSSHAPTFSERAAHRHPADRPCE